MSKQAKIHKVKEDLNLLAKTLAREFDVKVEFDEDAQNNFFKWNENLVEKQRFIVPEIEKLSEEKLITKSRATLDMAIAYFLFHKNVSNPLSLQERDFLRDFERVRVLKNLEGEYLGCAQNILEKLEEDIFFSSQNFSLLLLDEVLGKKLLPRTKNFAEELKEKITPKIAAQIKKLAKNIKNQEAFTLETTKLLEMILQENDSKEVEDEGEGEGESEKLKDKKEKVESFGSESAGEKENDFTFEDEEKIIKEESQIEEFAEVQEGEEAEKNISLKDSESTKKKSEIEFINAYKVFTSAFDEVVYPQKLVSKHDLDLLWDQLEIKLSKLSDISRKMTLKLKKKLLSKRSAMLEFNSSRGILNRKKLTNIILDPMMEDIWINKFEHEYQNTALTILLDNSGSMRGAPIVMSAMVCKIIAEILEKFSVKCEIIGFTTVDWKGGRARKIWETSGRIKNPGRLTDLRHIIYKSFNSNFKKSKANLGLMLKEGILKENIDGEALLFARSRLMQQSEARKILMVISDGTPIDDSTLANNDADILSNHLTHVVNKIEKSKKIEIVGVGIGHDTSNFYKNSIVIKDLEELGDVMINKLCEIL
jgi:cobaltochelatase CobT